MKKIIIYGEEFYYKVKHGEYSNYTSFYKLIKSKIFFVKNNKYSFAFEVLWNIEDPILSKEDVKKIIIEKYNRYLIIIRRQKEINKGEII